MEQDILNYATKLISLHYVIEVSQTDGHKCDGKTAIGAHVKHPGGLIFTQVFDLPIDDTKTLLASNGFNFHAPLY